MSSLEEQIYSYFPKGSVHQRLYITIYNSGITEYTLYYRKSEDEPKRRVDVVISKAGKIVHSQDVLATDFAKETVDDVASWGDVIYSSQVPNRD